MVLIGHRNVAPVCPEIKYGLQNTNPVCVCVCVGKNFRTLSFTVKIVE